MAESYPVGTEMLLKQFTIISHNPGQIGVSLWPLVSLSSPVMYTVAMLGCTPIGAVYRPTEQIMTIYASPICQNTFITHYNSHYTPSLCELWSVRLLWCNQYLLHMHCNTYKCTGGCQLYVHCTVYVKDSWYSSVCYGEVENNIQLCQ